MWRGERGIVGGRGMWKILKGWFGRFGKGAQSPKTARAAKPRDPAKRTAAPEPPLSRERLIEQALAVRAEKRAVLDELDPATRARIERAALGKLKDGDKERE
jgi:hypothetical protein